jgi:hypothetical protein
MFANELIKIIGKVKKREMLVPRRIHVGMTAEGSQRMIYELKVLYKRKSRESSIHHAQNISITVVTLPSKARSKHTVLFLQIARELSSNTTSKIPTCVCVCLCVSESLTNSEVLDKASCNVVKHY